MNDTYIKCPVCGAVNREPDSDETDGWMKCEECRSTVQIMKYVKTRRVPDHMVNGSRILIPLTRKNKS